MKQIEINGKTLRVEERWVREKVRKTVIRDEKGKWLGVIRREGKPGREAGKTHYVLYDMQGREVAKGDDLGKLLESKLAPHLEGLESTAREKREAREQDKPEKERSKPEREGKQEKAQRGKRLREIGEGREAEQSREIER